MLIINTGRGIQSLSAVKIKELTLRGTFATTLDRIVAVFLKRMKKWMSRQELLFRLMKKWIMMKKWINQDSNLSPILNPAILLINDDFYY